MVYYYTVSFLFSFSLEVGMACGEVTASNPTELKTRSLKRGGP